MELHINQTSVVDVSPTAATVSLRELGVGLLRTRGVVGTRDSMVTSATRCIRGRAFRLVCERRDGLHARRARPRGRRGCASYTVGPPSASAIPIRGGASHSRRGYVHEGGGGRRGEVGGRKRAERRLATKLPGWNGRVVLRHVGLEGRVGGGCGYRTSCRIMDMT